MISEQEIYKHFSNYRFDITESHNGRWIDQKCTPDVVCIISDCVVNFLDQHGLDTQFSSTDIWRNDYTRNFVEEIFSKPDTNHKKSANEYDKFFSQPLELLAASKVLNKTKKGNRNIYTINNYDLLEFISLRDNKTVTFLDIYIRKVLNESGIWKLFLEFFDIQTQESYIKLKTNYENFIINNTNINGKTEVRRIFAKVLNPLAYKFKKLGTQRGRLSKTTITYSTLMYNQENFRDINNEKPKNMTRQEWQAMRRDKVNVDFYRYQATKAKKLLQKYNNEKRNGKSEIFDDLNQGVATQMHHIFPQSQYPEISSHLENLIALTPSQHFLKAHPNNNTQIIDVDYQELLLKAKVNIIEEDIDKYGDNSIYDFDHLAEVINTGFDIHVKFKENDYIMMYNIINNYYKDI